jgi:hypothetical protein
MTFYGSQPGWQQSLFLIHRISVGRSIQLHSRDLKVVIINHNCALKSTNRLESLQKASKIQSIESQKLLGKMCQFSKNSLPMSITRRSSVSAVIMHYYCYYWE